MPVDCWLAANGLWVDEGAGAVGGGNPPGGDVKNGDEAVLGVMGSGESTMDPDRLVGLPIWLSAWPKGISSGTDPNVVFRTSLLPRAIVPLRWGGGAMPGAWSAFFIAANACCRSSSDSWIGLEAIASFRELSGVGSRSGSLSTRPFVSHGFLS